MSGAAALTEKNFKVENPTLMQMAKRDFMRNLSVFELLHLDYAHRNVLVAPDVICNNDSLFLKLLALDVGQRRDDFDDAVGFCLADNLSLRSLGMPGLPETRCRVCMCSAVLFL